MPFRYSQATGALIGPQGGRLATGYSGHGAGVNNPELQAKPNIGPIPRGLYSIGPAFDHPKLGPVSMRLTPVGHNALGRTAFLIHGDNGRGDRSASEGCIIMPRIVREAVAANKDRMLLVE